ncbi:MAG: glycine cleavage system aminomethyltransferase GcvT [Gammaproteobacteria bacterium]|nr:glycine cleavage system aminomethyltransferase GcvT [Gammaproteobacteria bacterium]
MGNDALLERTPLFDLHLQKHARMVPFAGYEMPVQYPLGIMKEHLHTREKAGLFDVSHMGQVHLLGAGADAALEALTPADIVSLPGGKQRYALLTNDQGGILDDLMVIRSDTHFVLVLNADRKAADVAHLEAALGDRFAVDQRTDLALLALQGPAAQAVLARLSPAAVALKFMDAAAMPIAGVHCFVSRSGYTGEDGYEISVAASDAVHVAEVLLAHEAVELIGLGARDSLRLEAGLCLYGHDIDTTTTPVEARLVWSIGKSRRPGGERAGGYPGHEVIARQLAVGPSRKRVGLRPAGRAPVREGAPIQDAAGRDVGRVTSGGFGPTVGAPVAMGYVESDVAAGSELKAMVRGKALEVAIAPLPFAVHRYCR